MPEYIEREAALKNIDLAITKYSMRGRTVEFIADCRLSVIDAPAADVAEVRHGYWKKTQGEVGNPFNNQVFDTIDFLVCSVCNEVFDVSEARNYCPNCGAKMDGERK